MIIYSEITGKQYDSIEECLAEERLIESKRLEQEKKRAAEVAKLKQDISETYKTLVNTWVKYTDLLEKADYDIEDLEAQAILFVEVINDAERRKTNTPKS